MGLKKRFLSPAFVLGAHHISSYGLLGLLSCCDLRFCLIDSGESAFDTRILKLALASIVFNRSLRSRDRRSCLCYLGLVIVIFQLNQKVSLMHLLEVGDLDIPNYPGNLRAERRQVPPHVGVVRHLLDSAALPGIPVPRDRGYHGSRKQDDQHGSSIGQPFRLVGWCGSGGDRGRRYISLCGVWRRRGNGGLRRRSPVRGPALVTRCLLGLENRRLIRGIATVSRYHASPLSHCSAPRTRTTLTTLERR